MLAHPEFHSASVRQVLEFLPAFERGDFRLVLDHYLREGRDAESVASFASAVASSGFMLQFDWPAWWRTEGRALVDGGRILSADMSTLRKIVTCWVRGDRLSGGALATVCADGRVLEVLRRMQALLEHAG